MNRYFARLRTSPTQQALVTAITIMVLNGLLFITPIYRMIGANTVLWINNLTNIAAALISIWLGFRLWRSTRYGESQRMIWGSLTAGLTLWAVAEITWDLYQVLRGIKQPTTSPADIAWVLGYLAVIVGLILRLRTLRMRPTKAWQFALLAGFGLLAVLAVIYIILPILNKPQSGVSYDKITGFFYAVFDLVIVFLALLLVVVLQGGLLSKPWAAIALSCFCVAISNLLYTFALSHGIFQVNPAGGLDLLSYSINISYTCAYILMALGLYLQARLLDAI
jgi:hypothetical protein